MRAPADEVVHLHQVDTPAEERQLACELDAARSRRVRPDFGRDERLISAGAERASQGLLGAAVHRRRVEHSDASGESRRDDGVRDALSLWRDIEDLPRSETDDGKLDGGRAE
jgi:hypothetical protein